MKLKETTTTPTTIIKIFIYAFGDPDGAGRTIASLLTTIFSTSIK